MDDIIIVGGGPAGAYLGYCLAKKGINATIFDDSHPREKPCGGGLSHLALKRFPLVKKTPGIKGIGRKIRLIAPSGREARVGSGYIIGISRLLLDKFLLDKAVESGAKLVKDRVVDIKNKGGVWEIKTSQGTKKTKLLIGADGVNSIVRRKVLGPFTKRNLTLTFGYFAKGLEKEITLMKFLKNRKGYLWVFPRGDHTSIGVCAELQNSKGLKKELDNFIHEYYSKIKILSQFAALIPSAKDRDFFQNSCTGRDWILIGDAAGHVDPISSEGISYAMWSAELAAKAITGGDHKKFDDLWREAYGYNLTTAINLKEMLYNPTMLDLSLRIANKSKTYSQFLFNLMVSEENYDRFLRKSMGILPRSIVEYIFSKA
jgi:geranylgeranyl reductase family protein